ncbi:MAG TPA: TonB-dependent receptor, partial [Sphingobacteriaceae bacterium]
MKKILLSLFVMLLTASGLFAQVTTSSLTGTVRDDKETLIGASVKATHTPSGTVYGASTNASGNFTIPNMRVGGPYTIEVSYVGYQPKTVTNVTLRLGEPYVLNVSLVQGAQLNEVVITALSKEDAFNAAKTGASTNISTREIATMPTVSRSITDLTKLTPQANGTSFGGRDNRLNNIQVDGANMNNNFGLSSDPLPGGGAMPISIEAYDQISVNIAPYDVRQSGFTGAGINAVTKSGTNTFTGSAYGYYRDQSFIGTKVGDNDISSSIVDSKNQTYGFSLGGPLVKNKLFFFVNAEREASNRPGIGFTPTGGSGAGTVSAATVGDLLAVSNYLRTNFGYETGAYDNFPNFESGNRKILAKLDWNINRNHKFTVKYSDFDNNNDQQMNATSVPNGGGFSVTGATNNISRLPNSRFGSRSMAFANSNYQFHDVTRSGTAELNSTFGGKISNQFLVAFTKNQTTRAFDGPVFPTIDIFNGAGQNVISVGMDPYTNNNDVINDIFSVTNNFTYYAGKHTLTAGGTYEYQKVGNMFMAGSNSYYVFDSVNDFITDQAPRYYAYTYSLVPGKSAIYSAELKIGQLGFYAQDEWNVNDKLRLTLGIRGDLPVYHEQPISNPFVKAMQFYDENGKLTNYDTGVFPENRLLLSPRVGFRYDAFKDNSLVVRGGTGLFTGKIPFVWLTNIPTNSGMYQLGMGVTSGANLSTIRFSADPDAYADASFFPKTAGTSAPSNLVFADPNFKFPQIFRTNLAVDKSFGNGLTATIEGMYTKDINAVRMFNANTNPENATITEANGVTRPRITGGNRLNGGTTSAIVLTNTKKGHSGFVTAQVNKSFNNGFFGSLAYTYTNAKEVSANPGSQASSVWNANPNVGTSNSVELGYGDDYAPHRVVGLLSYRKEYAKHFATAVSLFYEGGHQGSYSFVVNGDMNGDGNNSTDLMYIPNNASDLNFEQYTSNGVTFTPSMQAAALEQFINNSSYLKNNRGQFAERNAARTPWLNRLDLKFLQDFYITQSGKKHTLQFSADVLNFSNLLNKEWGIRDRFVINNPLQY